MECLSCGECCLRTLSEPCTSIVRVDGNIYLCTKYKDRPEQCKDYSFPNVICPVGVEKLNITQPHVLQRRLDDIWEAKMKIKNKEVSHNGIGADC